MIESISIAGTSTFGATPENLEGLAKLNFFFGSNGTGKTTISRVIANEAAHPSCTVKWKAAAKLQTLVYNNDFVERNFTQSSELKGVFTLGEKQRDTLAKIAEAKLELDKIKQKTTQLAFTLHGPDGYGGKKKELAELENSLKDKCWSQKLKYDAKLQGGFEGYRGSMEKFKAKVLLEHVSNDAPLLTLAELEEKAKNIFGPTPTIEAMIQPIDMAALLAYEARSILKKKVLGKEDVDISAMIKKLGNSDWVREGRKYYNDDAQICPFCQQQTNSAFSKSLQEYFDETFLHDSKEIEGLATGYASEAHRIQQIISSLLTSKHKFLDAEKLKLESELFDAQILLNNQRLGQKKKEPSQAIDLESLESVCVAINALIDAANAQVAAHNKIVANLAAERGKLTAQIWAFVVEELKADLVLYSTAKTGLEEAIKSLTHKIADSNTEQAKKNNEIVDLEKQITSIQPTLNGINGLLSTFGFQSFKLAKAESGEAYKLVRHDGSDAKTTLSEGEKTFVTFLYFYHLLKGSDSSSGITADRVIVFDDPISSLDSDILFIVSSLIKGLFDEVRGGSGGVKQVFVLTHNVYFHKEVTYNASRKGKALSDETFWVVKKPNNVSKVERFETNPIKTSYELLWEEVRKPERVGVAFQNTLRRILENYFKILGGTDLNSLCAKFDGKEKIVCRSLCSWINDGSHYALDDLHMSSDEALTAVYLKVFRSIFVKLGHGEHYKMMMADAFVEEESSKSDCKVSEETATAAAQ